MKSAALAFLLLSLPLTAQAAPEGGFKILQKSCSGQALAFEEGERVNFREGMFARILVTVRNGAQTCYRIEAYNRLVTSFTTGDKLAYTEDALLTPAVTREACQVTESGAPLSDTTSPWSGAQEGLSVVMASDRQLTAELKGNHECPDGTLRLEGQRID